MEEKENAKAKGYYEALQVFIKNILLMMLLFTFVFRLSVVRGHSMLPSLQEQDLLLVVSRPLCGSFSRGISWCCKKQASSSIRLSSG